jgi:hypothetical protein
MLPPTRVVSLSRRDFSWATSFCTATYSGCAGPTRADSCCSRDSARARSPINPWSSGLPTSSGIEALRVPPATEARERLSATAPCTTTSWLDSSASRAFSTSTRSSLATMPLAWRAAVSRAWASASRSRYCFD